MTEGSRPIKSPRRVYGIANLARRPDANGDLQYQAAQVKLKVSIAKALGIEDDEVAAADLYRTVTRNGVTYTVPRGLGGYRVQSFKLVAKSTFSIDEVTGKNSDGTLQYTTREFKSISIGMPVGVSLNRFCRWIMSTTGSLKNDVDFVITPAGARRPLQFITEGT